VPKYGSHPISDCWD